MTQLLSPRQIARALAVSESSIKRWCDSGVIPTEHTPGGHRRVPLSGLLEFLRESDRKIADPRAIGLVTSAEVRKVDTAAAVDRLTQLLFEGHEPAATQVLEDLLIAKLSAAAICDQVLAPAMHRIGDLWSTGAVEVYQERRACEIVLHSLRRLESLLPSPAAAAPLAIGGALSGDQYSTPNAMARLVLRAAGWRASSLGENLPMATLVNAVRREKPKLVWLSCAACIDERGFVDNYMSLQEACGSQVAIVVGGRALNESLRQRLTYSAYCDTMGHFASFLNALRTPVGVAS